MEKDFAPKVSTLVLFLKNVCVTLYHHLFIICMPIVQWDPPSLKQVSKDMVDCYFSPLPEFEPELELPTASREPFM